MSSDERFVTSQTAAEESPQPGEAESVLAVVAKHHGEMAAKLREFARAAAQQKCSNGELQVTLGEAAKYLAGEILPHALAEENSVYLVARELGLGRLVEAMVYEHNFLAELIASLRSPLEADPAGVLRAIAEFFVAHAEKENRFILPICLSAASPITPEELLSTLAAEFRTAQHRSAAITPE